MRRTRGLRLLGFIVAAAGLLALAPMEAVAGVNAREARQRHRIAHGVQDGSLTRHEAHRLAHQQHRIERRERRFRANDGALGPRERMALDRSLDRSSRHIYRARHNERTRD